MIVIIGMDLSFAYYRALIDVMIRLTAIPLPNSEILEVQGRGPEKDLGITSMYKAMRKSLNDIPKCRDFPRNHHTGIKPFRNVEIVEPAQGLPEEEFYSDQVTHHGEHLCSFVNKKDVR
ncbi:hypothetical protein Tco_0565366 [Tanacetum coccineum]